MSAETVTNVRLFVPEVGNPSVTFRPQTQWEYLAAPCQVPINGEELSPSAPAVYHIDWSPFPNPARDSGRTE